MLKVITIGLPEKMIRQIDESLINGEFNSRSEFFRMLIWMWFHKPEQEVSSGSPDTLSNSSTKHDQIQVNPEIDLEYGIPAELVNKFAEKAKLLNK
jgi:Arc/MetJ-type ribon-helix-helix transcriptional regulator